ncbi:MAG: hypothetical protein AB8I08_31135 [Sandaracinaceae bacterium]
MNRVSLIAVLACACSSASHPPEGGVPEASLDATAPADAAAPRDARAPEDASAMDGGPRPPCPMAPPADYVYELGVSVFGDNDYIEYIPGDLPIVLSAPHGGELEPDELVRDPDSLAMDAQSLTTTRLVMEAFRARTGHIPHVIVNHVRRDRLNLNRADATPNADVPSAMQAFEDFHGFIEDAEAWVTAACGRGHYFDMHTNGGEPRWVEVGIALSKESLALEGPAFEALAPMSTYRTLAERVDISFEQLVRGEQSLGGLLEARAVLAVPSDASPNAGESDYFTGGYNVRRHGSRDGGVIDGSQMEIHFAYINSGAETREAFARDFTSVIQDFMRIHYGFDLGR